MSTQTIFVRLDVPVCLLPQDVRPYVDHVMAAKGLKVTGIQFDVSHWQVGGTYARCCGDEQTVAPLLQGKLGFSEAWSFDPMEKSWFHSDGSEPNWTDALFMDSWRYYVASNRPESLRSVVEDTLNVLMMMFLMPYLFIREAISDRDLRPLLYLPWVEILYAVGLIFTPVIFFWAEARRLLTMWRITAK